LVRAISSASKEASFFIALVALLILVRFALTPDTAEAAEREVRGAAPAEPTLSVSLASLLLLDWVHRLVALMRVKSPRYWTHFLR
jgi:hypothetical protein